MGTLIVCFYNWVDKDINWNNDITQENLVSYFETNYEYLKHNNFIKLMTLPQFITHINNEGECPEAICQIPITRNLLKKIS